MFSHHDAILSTVSIPADTVPPPDQELVTAPKQEYSRIKIMWSEEGILDYQEEVSNKLAEIRLRWLDPLSETSLTILLHRTNDILCEAAVRTNKFCKQSQINKGSKSY